MTTVQLSDAVPLSGIRKTKEGYLVAQPRVARTGIQLYMGDELGLPEFKGKVMRVYRPEKEVFSRDALASYAHRPVTLGHPVGGVSADNWKETSVGQTGDEVLRDGDFVRVPMTVMDGNAIREIENGTLQLSMGYSADIQIGDGVSPQGESYDAVQIGMRMNHLAIVPRARGGSQLRIGDYMQEELDMADAIKTRIVLVDGLPIETTDAGATVIEKLLKDVKSLNDAATATATEHSKALATKDAEIAALQSKVLSDADFDKKVSERIGLITVAARLAPKVKVDGLSDSEVRRAVVASLFGDSAVKDKDDVYVAVRFDIAAEDSKKTRQGDPLRGHFAPPTTDSSTLTDADTAYVKMTRDLETAYLRKEAN